MMSKSTRILFSLLLLMLIFIIGSAQLAAQQLIPPTTSLVQFTADPPPATGRAPNALQPTSGTIESRLAALTGNAAFLVDISPDVKMRYIPNTDIPEEWLSVSDMADTTAYFAGDFVGSDYSRIYVIDYYLNQLHTLDTNNATNTTDTTIGACSPISGQAWSGATGAADGTLYASSTNESISYLYTVNTTTGTATVVGQITNAPAIIDIAINADGEMYGVDITNDNLVQINPATGAGTVIGSIGFDADYAQSMDFEEVSGVLYLAAFNVTAFRGELRIANTATGSSTLVGEFPDGVQTDVLAFTPPTTQFLQNPGFENGWAYWHTESYPSLSSSDTHSGSWSVKLSGEECWVWQEVYIPSDVMDVSFGYWVTGLSSDSDWDNDILIGGIWDQSWQTKYVDVRYGLTYFYHYPKVWKNRIYRLDADELANVVGQRVLVGFQLTQDWNPGYHKTSTAWVDDVVLYVTRPVYDYAVYLPLIVK